MSTIKTDTSFINDDFLLQNKTAKVLYHDYAKAMPIIDYHNHLSAKQIALNEPFSDITDAWLTEDHYKWRAMRANGIDEKYITGDSTNFQKFEQWAATVPHTIKNPLFHWTHLELKRYFGISEILQPSTAKSIYEMSSEAIKQTSPRQLLSKMNVTVVCTTDDPIDDLKWHQQIAKSNFSIKVLPTFRADTVIDIENNSFLDYLSKLEKAANQKITDYNSLISALRIRVDYFHAEGCRLSDYGLSGPLANADFSENQVDTIIKKRIQNKNISSVEREAYQACLMYELAKMYHNKGWTQQYHLGAIRNNNSRLSAIFGSNAGCDSVGDYNFSESLSSFLDRLDSTNQLAKTITYNINPAQSETFATMMGNFNTNEIPSKMQWGAAWWFMDQKDGIEKHLTILSNLGLLSRFVGMLTDSRSFLSFTRHEYFRRILCNAIGTDVENGELPNDISFLGKIVQDVCYNNAKNYFGFDKV